MAGGEGGWSPRREALTVPSRSMTCQAVGLRIFHLRTVLPRGLRLIPFTGCCLSCKCVGRGRLPVPEMEPAGFSAEKKFLQSGSSMDVGLPLPLVSGVDLDPPATFVAQHVSEGHRRMRFCIRRGKRPGQRIYGANQQKPGSNSGRFAAIRLKHPQRCRRLPACS